MLREKNKIKILDVPFFSSLLKIYTFINVEGEKLDELDS